MTPAEMKTSLGGVADRVNRRVGRREMWAGALWAVAALAGLPLALWLYAWLFGQAGAPSGVWVDGLAIVAIVAAAIAASSHLSATYGRVRLFDDERGEASQ